MRERQSETLMSQEQTVVISQSRLLMGWYVLCFVLNDKVIKFKVL